MRRIAFDLGVRKTAYCEVKICWYPQNSSQPSLPVETEHAVWKRDDSQCTFVDGEGRRCAERRFLTLEHRTPFALGGRSTLENLCLLCAAHNLENARRVFGEPYIERKIRVKMRPGGAGATQTQPAEPQPLETPAKVLSSLTGLGFARQEASVAVGQALASEPGLDVEQLPSFSRALSQSRSDSAKVGRGGSSSRCALASSATSLSRGFERRRLVTGA
jgi:hypothetical protein